jgi:hypothetical protein
VREILVSKIFRALDPDPVKKGRDSKEGGGKGREVYDREWMGRKEREGAKRKVRKEGRKVLIPRDKSWIRHWSCNKICRLKNAV